MVLSLPSAKPTFPAASCSQSSARAGCDALAVYLIIAQIGGTLDVGPGPLGVIGTLAITIPWIGAQWEEYHSGLMLYGNGVVGITEVSDLKSLNL